MSNIEKVLAEFDEMFPNLGATDHDEGWYDVKTEVKAFIATSIHQAIAEERERVRVKTKGVRDSLLVYFHNAVNDQKAPYRHAIQAIEEEILSSLPLTDKE